MTAALAVAAALLSVGALAGAGPLACPARATAGTAVPAPQVGPHLDLGGLPAPVVGAAARAVPGVWDGAPAEYRYAWERCAPGSSACVSLPGAGPVYVPGAEDVGWALRARVAATGEAGTGEAYTATSPVVRVATQPSGGPAAVVPPGSPGAVGVPSASGMGARVRLRGVPATRTAGFGLPVRIAGRIVVAGSPGGREVELRDPSGRLLGRSRTDPDGRFAVTGVGDRPGTWTVALDGARRAVVVRLRPRIDGLVVTRLVTAPGVVLARGRLAPGVNGKVVELQYLDPGRGWRSWRQVRTGPGGIFTLARVLPRNPAAPRFTLRVRVVVPADRGWPFSPAVSAAREVAVR